MFLAPRGELAEADGDTVTALKYYGAFAGLWADADPGLQPQVRAVRERMTRLAPDLDLDQTTGAPRAGMRGMAPRRPQPNPASG